MFSSGSGNKNRGAPFLSMLSQVRKYFKKGVNSLKNLRNLRKAANLTQPELAAMLGITHGAVAAWELGRCYPSSDKLPELARVLDCSIDDLYADAEKAG